MKRDMVIRLAYWRREDLSFYGNQQDRAPNTGLLEGVRIVIFPLRNDRDRARQPEALQRMRIALESADASSVQIAPVGWIAFDMANLGQPSRP